MPILTAAGIYACGTNSFSLFCMLVSCACFFFQGSVVCTCFGRYVRVLLTTVGCARLGCDAVVFVSVLVILSCLTREGKNSTDSSLATIRRCDIFFFYDSEFSSE